MADFDVTEGLLASGELLLTKKQSPAQREAAQVRPTMHCAFTPSSLTNDPNPIHFADSNCKRLRYYHSHHPGHGGIDTCPYPRAFCCSNWTSAFANDTGELLCVVFGNSV